MANTGLKLNIVDGEADCDQDLFQIKQLSLQCQELDKHLKEKTSSPTDIIDNVIERLQKILSIVKRRKLEIKSLKYVDLLTNHAEAKFMKFQLLIRKASMLNEVFNHLYEDYEAEIVRNMELLATLKLSDAAKLYAFDLANITTLVQNIVVKLDQANGTFEDLKGTIYLVIDTVPGNLNENLEKIKKLLEECCGLQDLMKSSTISGDIWKQLVMRLLKELRVLLCQRNLLTLSDDEEDRLKMLTRMNAHMKKCAKAGVGTIQAADDGFDLDAFEDKINNFNRDSADWLLCLGKNARHYHELLSYVKLIEDSVMPSELNNLSRKIRAVFEEAVVVFKKLKGELDDIRNTIYDIWDE